MEYSSYQDAQRGIELGTSQSRIGLSVHCSTHISLHLHPCPKLALHQYRTPTAEIGLQLTKFLEPTTSTSLIGPPLLPLASEALVLVRDTASSGKRF